MKGRPAFLPATPAAVASGGAMPAAYTMVTSAMEPARFTADQHVNPVNGMSRAADSHSFVQLHDGYGTAITTGQMQHGWSQGDTSGRQIEHGLLLVTIVQIMQPT
jgi:hypothetical protein